MIKTPFPSFNKGPKSRKPQNRVTFARVTWRMFITARPFKQKPKKLGDKHASPSGQGRAARRFLFRNLELLRNAGVAWWQFIARQAVSEKILETQNSSKTGKIHAQSYDITSI